MTTAAMNPPALNARPATLFFDDTFLRHLERLALRARRRGAQDLAGDRPSRRIGLGVDFADHRAYVPGDDLRALDWNVYARSDRLVTRQFEATDDSALTVLLDTSGSMSLGSPPKSLFARRVAAAVSYLGLVRAGCVSVHGFAQHLHEGLVGLRGRARAAALFSHLGGLVDEGPTDLLRAARNLTAHPWHRRHRGLVLVLSDFAAGAEETAKAFSHLRQQGFEPVLSMVSAPDERASALALAGLPEGTDVELWDPETGAMVEVSVSAQLHRAWQERHRAFTTALLQRTRRAGVAAVALDTATRVEDAALSAMREAGLIH